jgi:hypothetical protein
MITAVQAEGCLEGGHTGARRNLADFWRSISVTDMLPPAERMLYNLRFMRQPRCRLINFLLIKATVEPFPSSDINGRYYVA